MENHLNLVFLQSLYLSIVYQPMPANSQEYSIFETLFRAHYNALANYAFSIVKNQQDAEDVVQEVFIRLWQHKPAAIKTDQAKFYMLTATKNACISLLRKQAGKFMVEPDAIQLSDTADETASTGDVDIAAVVDKALATLPPQCLAIFKMSRFGQLTYQQIAGELGISVKTVENQMGKALKIMRTYAKQHNISFALLMCWLCGIG
jgi:RNA polymerase sigma-70 factor (family 1)